jgi:hypothetical protein
MVEGHFIPSVLASCEGRYQEHCLNNVRDFDATVSNLGRPENLYYEYAGEVGLESNQKLDESHRDMFEFGSSFFCVAIPGECRVQVRVYTRRVVLLSAVIVFVCNNKPCVPRLHSLPFLGLARGCAGDVH